MGETMTEVQIDREILQEENGKLRSVLADIVASIEDYERVNNLAPNPPRMSCWDCVATAKALLSEQNSVPKTPRQT